VWLVCGGSTAYAGAIGTAWTYQGRLIDNNDVAHGIYDFQFGLFDSAADGNQLGGNANLDSVEVEDGYFTVELDFGEVFDGNTCWLEIGVRPGEQSDPNVFTTLVPRQEVTPTPYAIYAESAGSDGDWMVSGNDMYSIPSGNVGIGTTSPQSTVKLEVKNSADAGAAIAAYASGDDSSAVFGCGASGAQAAIQGSANGADFAGYFDGKVAVTGGNVGIGTISPQAAVELEVRSSTSGGAAVAAYATGEDNSAILGVSSSNGHSAIQGNANGADYAGYFVGDVYVTGTMSAQTVIDRTAYPKDLQTAYEAVMSMERLPDGGYDETDREHQLDHSKLSDFIRSEHGNRDLSAAVSCQNEVLKDVVRRLEEKDRLVEKLSAQNRQLQEQLTVLTMRLDVMQNRGL